MKLSIIVPVYNDKQFIARTIDQIRAVTFSIPYEIVAVDDASTDGSREVLEKISGITKIFHQKNTGKGGAVASGLKSATGDIIVIQDDDCEYDPAAIPSLIEPILSGTTQVVYGSRFLQKNSMYFIQYLENKAITTLANILLGQQLTDIETGHKVFTRQVASQLDLKKKGFEFDMEITLQIIKAGIHITEKPTIYQARTHAQGKKITYKDGWHSVVILLKTWLQIMHEKSRSRDTQISAVLATTFLILVFLPRLASLGQILTVDEPLWQSRGQTFISALAIGDFGKTLVAGQPGITTAWLAGLVAHSQSLAAAQAAIAIATGILVLIATYFFRQLLGRRWGLMTGIFLALDPFLLAHSRVVHTDALLALFYLNSILALLTGMAYVKSTGKIQLRYLCMSSALAALTCLTKLYGLLLIPTATLLITAAYISSKERIRNIVRDIAIWMSALVLFAFIAWPALWTDGARVYDLLLSRTTIHAEGTRAEETTSTQWYYARELFFRTTATATILFPFAIWQFRLLKKSRHAQVVLSILLAALLYTVMLSTSSDKSDRYILFANLAITSAAPLGLRSITSMLKRRLHRQQALSWVVIIISIIVLSVPVIRLHPYYLAHYNRLYPIEPTHKLGWGEGLEQAAQYISDKHPKAKVLSYYQRVFSYFYSGETEDVGHINEATADYAVLYRSMFERGPNAPETDIINEFLLSGKHTPEKVITINNLPYVWIFRLSQGTNK